jgi:hypothetical protein
MTNQPERDRVTLDEAIAAVREDAPAPGVAEDAASRVWERIAPRVAAAAGAMAPIEGCADVRALLPAHRRGGLAAPRALLVDDHLRECVACRAAFVRPGERRLALLPWRPAVAQVRTAAAWPSYAAAASVMLATVAAWGVYQVFFAVPPGSRAAVHSVTGALQRVADDRTVALAPGEEVGELEPVRTGRTSRAVLRLRDGSLVEMGERAELSVGARGPDATIRLARGSIIVTAARRTAGHLRVASGDAVVSVTGTVFSVSHGLSGSRVSVLEGHVRVAAAGAEQALTPGEQWTSSEAVERVPLGDEIAWSGDADRHLALLAELKVLRERWQAVRTPGLRYESRLLRLVPAETLVVASLPNYGETLADAHRLFEERLQESAVLREWWAKADPARHGAPSLASVIEKVRTFSEFLGDEVLMAMPGAAPHRAVPVLLAEVRRPGLPEFLEQELTRLGSAHGGRPRLRIVGETVEDAPDAQPELIVLVRGGVMAVSIDAAALRDVAMRLDSGAAGVEATPFGARLAQAYEDGVGILFAADLERMRAAVSTGADVDGRRGTLMAQAGLDALQYLMLERKQVAEAARTQAVLTFQGPPRGVPSWLAAPAPMGSLDFVSAGAQAAAAFVVKSPALIFDEVLSMAALRDSGAGASLATLEEKIGIHLRQDLAETLGGEFAIALDGPLLPTPAWKVVVEVYDPARLQHSLQTLVARANDELARVGRPAIRLQAEQVGGETYYAVQGGGLPVELHYAFDHGYAVAAPSRALVMRALRVRAEGESLPRSAAFRRLFPPDRGVDVSGLLYQNLGTMVGSLLDAPAVGLSDEQRRSVEALARDTRPTLLCAYGEPDAIRVAGMGGAFDFETGDLALPLLLERVLPGTMRRATP